MRKAKRLLALLLALSMVFSMNITAFATENLTDTETTKVAEENPDAGIATTAITMGTKPADGTTKNQPFISEKTGESKYFRIPAMVTLSDGTIVAAADARWNTTADNGGLDTIVSRSSDNGATWNYTYANYLGDNGNVYNDKSSCFIDPALVVDANDTIYMLVTMYSGGHALSNGAYGRPTAENAFDGQGRLLLKKNGDNNYSYYLDGNRIKNSKGNNVKGITVDENFNLLQNNSIVGNLFYDGAAYQVTPTTYLCLKKSTDKGATWSAPQLLNVKGANEDFYGVGPGRGLVTSTGRIIFPCYVNPNEYTSVIYSDDDGATWKRSANMSNNSSEATLVEADGRIYMFTRHGGYYISTNNGTDWSARKETGLDALDSCQRSAITYSQKIDGKTAILLSCPSGSARSNGKIYVALVNEDGSLDFKYEYKVTDGEFAYSCLTELKDGTVGLLYENASGSILYDTYSIDEIAVMIPSFVDNAGKTVESVSFTEGDAAKTLKFNGVESNQTLTIVSKDENVVTAVYDATTGNVTVTPVKAGETVIVATVQDNTRAVTEYELRVTVKEPKVVDITIPVGYNKQIKVGADTITSNSDDSVASAEIIISEGKYAKVNEIESGKQYLIANALQGRAILQPISATEGNNKGLKLFATNQENYITGDYDSNLWTVTNTSGDTYNIQSPSGEYLKISTYNDVQLQQNEAEAVLYNLGNEKFEIVRAGNETMSLNNFGRRNEFASSYTRETGDNAAWYFYEYANENTLQIYGNKVGKTTIVVGDITYNITVREQTPENLLGSGLVGHKGQGTNKVITKLTTNVGMTFDTDLKDKLLDGQTVEWVSDDPNVARVDKNGTITGESVGNTIIRAIVKDSTGKVVAENPIDVTVLAGNGSDGTLASKVFDFYIDKIEDTTVYYSLNCTTDLVEVKEHEAIYLSFNEDSDVAMNFFGDPNDGYALTFMNAPGSAGEYESLQDKSNPKNTEFYTHGAARNQTGPFGDQKVCDMIQKAMDVGCDGAQGFTRPNNNITDVPFTLSFRSEKLPTVKKEIVSITHGETTTPYTESMPIYSGDIINYEIKVKRYASQDGMMYSSAELTETLAPFEDDNFVKNKIEDDLHEEGTEVYKKNTDTLLGYTFKTDKEFVYKASYTVKPTDINNELINTVNLGYGYSSAYSSGTFEVDAKAEAKVSVLPFRPHSYVVDFGLPVTFDFSDQITLAMGISEFDSVTSELAQKSMAEVSIDASNRRKIHYQLTAPMTAPDMVTITLKNSTGKITFWVLPATTVYYEEGFINLTKPEGHGWTTEGNKGSEEQAASYFGKSGRYGYDAKYAEEVSGPSNGTEVVSTNAGDKAAFTFTGTGVDIYANCTTETGVVSFQIINAEGRTVKLIQVDTKTGVGTSGSTTGQDIDSYNLPIASVSGLAHGDYTVKITHNKRNADEVGGDIKLDGFRVYGTADTENMEEIHSEVYKLDGEANPTFKELRDQVLAGMNVDITGSVYEKAGTILNQVYDKTGTTSGAIVVTGNQNYNIQDLLDNGPKNELFLRPGEAVTFKLSDAVASAQVGLKAINTQVAYSFNNGDSTTLKSSTDMFYDIDLSNNHEVTITNNSKDEKAILSITDVKAFGEDGSPVVGNIFAEMTQKAVVTALMSIGFEDETQTPETADATLNLNFVDYSGKTFASTSLTANGEVGTDAVFTADAIKEALPEGYTFLDASKITDQIVKYGESADITLKADKVATLNVTYVDKKGKTVGTAVFTNVQNSKEKSFTFKSNEIKKAVPKGYKANKVDKAVVDYGTTKNMTVNVF